MYKETRDYRNAIHTIHVLHSKAKPELIAARIRYFKYYRDEFVEVLLNHEGLRRGYDLLLRRDAMISLVNDAIPKRGEGTKKKLWANASDREVKVWIPEGYLNEVKENVRLYNRTVRGLNVVFK